MRTPTIALLLATACASRPEARGPTTQVLTLDTVLHLPGGGSPYPRQGGGFVVLSYSPPSVSLRDSTGTEEGRLGREGAGPGEFRLPRGLVLRADTIGVLDMGNLRLVNFLPQVGYVSSRPLPKGTPGQMFTLLSGDTLLRETNGNDSALAVLQGPDGALLARYGRPQGPPLVFVDFGELRAQVARGEVPGLFRNSVLPVLGRFGDIWLVYQTTGVIERYSLEGHLLASAQLPEEHVRASEREFFRANREDPKQWVWSFQVVQNAVATRAGLLVALRRPDSLPARLMSYDTAGALGSDRLVPNLPGNVALIHDPWDDQVLYYDANAEALLRERP